MNVRIPSFEDAASRQLDWLELTAIYSEQSRARLDELENSFEIEEDSHNGDVGDECAAFESFREAIASEIAHRTASLGTSYPFVISKNGEEVQFKGLHNLGHIAYLVSLIVEHSWRDGLLAGDRRMNGHEAQRLRNAFEVLAAIALAGFARGPSFLIGTNRAGANGLLDRVRLICERAADGRQRAEPLADAPIDANDDGVDVIALTLELNGPPPRAFHFGQSASGQDWKEKSIKVEVEKFVRNWFDIPPTCNITPVMLVPRLPDRKEALQQTNRLGHLAHRLRLPAYALDAATVAETNLDHIDCWDRREEPKKWLISYLGRLGVHVG